DSSFTDLPAGGYTVGVIDSHGCTWNQAMTITTQPLVPLVNFLVATQQNVLDTLQVEDISSPRPDSVQWSFDTATLLLGHDTLGPLIRYTKPGTYPASMRAYYTGCDFSISQNILIQPYDTNSTSPMVLAGLSIDTATLAPNPNSGTFNLYVKLYKAQRLVLTVTSLAGQPVFRKQWDGQQIISEQISLPSNIVSGAYIAELVTETDIRDYNIIVTK
ncbi:MAG TPA: T9SS type A sorting domain-containing protein, partial [Puia sp.]|nr:T9SS type A sorting domain-containing protein [Puia sp.]